MPAGYLGNNLPDSLLLLPPPPAENSAGFSHDQAVHDAAQALKGTARYTLATADANLHLPHATTAFECALGVPITQADTPRLYQLMQRVMVDAGLGTYTAKNHYKRIRPFVHYNEHTCLAADEAALRGDGSYPSGHTSLGWAWSLVLTDLSPERANALLARGRAFGESRLVCNAHWQSDVLEGRTIGAGVVAQLQSNPTFQADMQAARKEIAAQRTSGKSPGVDCAAEAKALAIKIPGVL
ncbi:phosphatase PAP2 family protein [Thermomonas sp. HDW16]|uniref:acid phosphatase n=1 Tax=Thermomonas sp. HDW16 TaxID=2714945 RepID=UPI001F10856C|nr:phosphatase PAP2 family protein [Thermomonas sp. HDW16]